MSPKERAAFVRGYRHALWKARRELAEMTQRWDRDLAELDDRMRAAHEQTARSIDAELDGVRAEMLGMRNDYRRLKAIEKAIAAERDIDTWLN
jgi:hypothetical protein